MGALGNSPPMGEQMCVTSTLAPGLPNSLQYTLIATGGAGDCRVRLARFGGQLVDAAGDCLGRGHSSTIRSIKFAPDGKQLVSVGEDGACLVWNLFVEEIFRSALRTRRRSRGRGARERMEEGEELKDTWV